MSAALFNLDNDGTLEILISRANIKKITRVTVAEPGRKTAKTFLSDVPPLESEWELNPGRCTCEHFRCKKCHFINCVAVIAVFKIKAHIHMNETTLNSQKAKHSERRVESHSEEHPVTLP